MTPWSQFLAGVVGAVFASCLLAVMIMGTIAIIAALTRTLG